MLGIREFRSPTQGRDYREGILGRFVVKLGSLPAGMAIPFAVMSIVVFVGGLSVEDELRIQTDPIEWINQSSDTIKDLRTIERETDVSSELGVFIQSDDVFTDESVEYTHNFTRDLVAANPDLLLSGSSVETAVGDLLYLEGTTDVAPLGEAVESAWNVAPEAIQKYTASDDGTAMNVAFLAKPGDLDRRGDLVRDIRDNEAPPAGISLTPSGLVVVGVGLVDNLEANRILLTYLAIVFVGLFLAIRLRSITRSLLSLVPVLIAVGAASLFAWAFGFQLSPMTAVGGPLVVAMCTEFTSLILLRFVEERQRGLEPQEAADVAAARTGRAFVVSALTSVTGVAVLASSSLPLLRDFGLIVALNVLVALASALIVLPPMLVWADRRNWVSRGMIHPRGALHPDSSDGRGRGLGAIGSSHRGDASFLYMENSVVHMHVTGLMLLDPSDIPGGYDFGNFRNHVIGRLHLIPHFRRRLVTVPLGIDHPVWVEDPDFDIDDHLHRIVLRAPGLMEDLETWVGSYASTKLDYSKPLWDMVLMEGLRDGRIALVSKMHHVAVDGVSGADMLVNLVDLSQTFDEPPDPEAWEPARMPSTPEVVVDAVWSRATDPLRTFRALGRTADGAVKLARAVIDGRQGGPSMARPFEGPRSRLNASLTPRRSVSIGSARLDDLKSIKSTFGTTVNDVFLAACTASLRDYLRARGDRCARPLVCSVPVSVHGRAEESATVNQVSNMFVRLPVDVEDPVEQLMRVRSDTRDAKIVHGALGADVIGDVTELTPPAIFNLASRMYSGSKLAERLPPIHNLIISNVPGPPVPLFVAGAKIVGIYPFGPLTEGSGLNITVLSNMGNMDIGVISCPDTVPGAEDITRGIESAITTLVARAEDEHRRRAD